MALMEVNFFSKALMRPVTMNVILPADKVFFEEEAEEDMLSSGLPLSADVLKLGHHGSSSSTSDDFLSAVDPTWAVISCAEGNKYGHPHAETMNKLRAAGVSVFRTDEQGTITATTDGTTITWNASPSETWQTGEGRSSE